MRVFWATKPAELEAALVENGIYFEHPDEDPAQFLVSDDAVDTVNNIARKMMIGVYIKDAYVTEYDALSERELE